MIKIKKGLRLPISGVPSQFIDNARPVSTVALTGPDYVGMKPTMRVKEGEEVKVGQVLFECKKVPGVLYTSPAHGIVKKINRGERRVFQTVEIELKGHEQVNFEHYAERESAEWTVEQIRALLIESGMWAALRTRPFSKAPAIDSTPSSIFINAMDTNPLAADPSVVVAGKESIYKAGVEILSKLSPKTFVVKAEGSSIPDATGEGVENHSFSGPHPAGLVGTHIHFLDPVNQHRTVWHISYQDVMAIGHLFQTGQLYLERVVSIAGPQAREPRLLRTRVGANINELIEGEVKNPEITRVISGSVFNGRQKDDVFSYLGAFHQGITLIEEQIEREFLGWQGPGYDKFSVKNTFAGKFKNKIFDFKTGLYGSKRAMVPVGSFEKVMPMDILPTQLLRAVVTQDSDLAQDLGCLELDEEDLALCTFASPGKTDFGPYLRECLTIIEKEG